MSGNAKPIRALPSKDGHNERPNSDATVDRDTREFLELAQAYCASLESSLKRVPAPGEGDEFAKLRAPDRAEVIARLRSDLEVFHELVSQKHPLMDSPQLLWRFLVKKGLSPCHDLFEKINETDVVVIYDDQQRQIFQNLNFFNFVGLTLEQMFCWTWYQQTRRPSWALEDLATAAKALLSGEVRATIDPQVPEHEVEDLSDMNLKFFLRVNWLSPIYDGSIRPAGAIAINSCRWK